MEICGVILLIILILIIVFLIIYWTSSSNNKIIIFGQKPKNNVEEFTNPFIRNNATNISNQYQMSSYSRRKLFQGEKLINNGSILELLPTGDLVLSSYDGSVWKSNTANLPDTEGPYRLELSDRGRLCIYDSTTVNRAIWCTGLQGTGENGPYVAEVKNKNFQIVDRYNNIIWKTSIL